MKKLSKLLLNLNIDVKFLIGNTFERYYNSGIDAYNKKNYQKAIELFKLAIEQKNPKPQVYYNLALTYQSLKDYDRALANYSHFLTIYPQDYDGLYNIALVYSLRGNHEKAVEFFEKCVEIKKEADSVRALVNEYLDNNQYEQAVDFSNQILESEKNGIQLYLQIAKVFENKNPFAKDYKLIDTAIEMNMKIIEIDPKIFDAYLSLSFCYAKKGEFGKSVDFCEKALVENPNSYEANSQMGLVYYCSNEVEEAIKYFEKALKINPDTDYKIYSNLAYAYEKIGKNDKASKIFLQLLQKFSEFPAKQEIKHHLRILKSI